MNVAMKALSLGGTLKSGMDRAGGVAAGVLGLATQQEVANLRATIQQLEDTVSTLEPRRPQPGPNLPPRCFYCGQFGARPSRGNPKHMWVWPEPLRP